MAAEDPLGVGIDHKDGLPEGIEQDAVRRFRADTREGKELGSKAPEVLVANLMEVKMESVPQKGRETFQRPCFLVEKPGGSDQRRQLIHLHLMDLPEVEPLGPLQGLDGQMGILPIGILG